MAHVSEEQLKRAHAIATHAQQVADRVIPRDSPPDFTLPQPPDGRGLPWWFGPDYQPTPEALAAFGPPGFITPESERAENPPPGEAPLEKADP